MFVCTGLRFGWFVRLETIEHNFLQCPIVIGFMTDVVKMCKKYTLLTKDVNVRIHDAVLLKTRMLNDCNSPTADVVFLMMWKYLQKARTANEMPNMAHFQRLICKCIEYEERIFRKRNEVQKCTVKWGLLASLTLDVLNVP